MCYCATARSPTKSGGGSSAISIWRRQALPIGICGRWRCESASSVIASAMTGKESSLRKQGPITTDGSCLRKSSVNPLIDGPRRMDPCFRRDDRLLRRRDSRPTDIPRRIAKTFRHHRGQVFCLARHAGAGAHGVAVLMREMRRRQSLLQRAGAFHHQFAKMHDAQISRAEMLAGAVGDRALAVLHSCVLFGDALDTGVAFCFLQLALDQIIVRLVTQWDIILVDIRDHAV